MEVKLSVTYTARPGMAAAFVEKLQTSGLQAKVKAEAGCLGYDYYLSAQDDTVLLREHWQSEEHLRAHLSQPHMAEIRAVKEEFILSTTLMRCTEEPYAL